MQLNKILGAALIGLGLAASASADVTLDPTSAAVANGALGSGAPLGFGATSLAGNGSAKGEFYISAASLFGSAVKLSDIASISYWTNKDGAAGAPDWTLLLYTAKQQGDASWYHSRLNAEPYFVNSASDPAGAWHQWSTGGDEALKFYDQPRSGTYGTYTDPTWAELTAGAVSWDGSGQSGASVDYSGEFINLFSLQTGSAWANGFDGMVDGLTITLVNGQSASVNFEGNAVPEPGSIALVGVALAGLGFARRRKA
ncbi:PEP-CTERM sorting domain-containing protein [Burkholderiaceae bacterium UC74_6]